MIRRSPSSLAGGPQGRARFTPRPPKGPSLGNKSVWALTFILVMSGLAWVLWPLFSILLASATFAYLLDPITDRLEARGIRREAAIGIIFASVALVGTILLIGLIPAVAGQFKVLSTNIRAYIDNLAGVIEPAVTFIETHTGHALPVDFDSLKQEGPTWLGQLSPDAREGIQQFLESLFHSSLGLFTTLINLALLPVFTFYLLRDWDRLVASIDDLIPNSQRARVRRLATEVDERLSAFVRGQITVCVVLGILYSTGLWLSGIDLAVAVGLLSGALFIVPYLGSIIGIFLGSVLCLMKFGIDIHLAYVALTFLIAGAIEGWFLTPVMVGDKVGLHPLVVMIALIAGASLAGIWGMLLAIPLTAVLDVLGSEWLRVYRSSKTYRAGH